MKKNTIRFISLYLSLIIMLSSIPVLASAESSESTNQPSTEFQPSEYLEEMDQKPLIIPDGQTIILPLVENSEDEREGFPEEKIENNELTRSLSVNANTVYAPTGVNSYYINVDICLDTTERPATGAMLQVLAKDGETVLAYAPGIDYSYRDYETGYYYTSYANLTMLQEIEAGTYSMQLVAGEKKNTGTIEHCFY